MRRLISVILILCLLALPLTGCSDNTDDKPAVTPTEEPTVSLFNFITDDRSTVFAANYQTDKPVSVSYGCYTEDGGFLSHSVSTETIDAVFNALSEIEVGGEALVLADDYSRRFIFTMDDGREYTFDFNVLSVDCGGTQYAVYNDTDLWNIPFPFYGETSIFSLYPDDVQAFAENFETDTPVSVSLEYNGGASSVSDDAEKIMGVFNSLTAMQVLSFTDAATFHKTSSDETKYSYTFTMSDGRHFTFAFSGGYLEFNTPFSYFCGVSPTDSPASFAFEGYETLSPALDKNGRKAVDESSVVAAAGNGYAVFLIRTDYISTGGNEVLAYDVTISDGGNGYQVIYNYGSYARYEYAEDFTATAPIALPVHGEEPEYAVFNSAEEFTSHLKGLAEQLNDTGGGSGVNETERHGLDYTIYSFLYEATINDQGEIESMQYLWLP